MDRSSIAPKGSRRRSSQHLVIAASSFLALCGQAAAADLGLPIKASAPAPLYSWSGFYLGGAVGYAAGHDTTIEYFTATGAMTGLQWDYAPKGPLGGLYAGANYQIGPAVLGIEADIEGTGIKGGFYDPALGGAGDTRVDWQGSLRGRLGFTNGNVMLYGTGGLAFADISHTYQNLLAATAETTAGIRTGWTVGAGIEAAINSNWLVRAEYRYADYGKYRFDSIVTFPGLTGEQHPTFSSMRIGAAYKF